MKWRKLGKVFDLARHVPPPGWVGYAQSPQALVMDDRIRIYFSTRQQEPESDKFLSHVAYVDMARDMNDVMDIRWGGILPLGELGCFDEHGIFPINVLRHNGLVYAYTCGWSRRVSVSVETGIGLAISHDDGVTFQRVGSGPVLSTSLHEPCLVGDAFVRVIDGVFHMWYIFGTQWKQYSPGSSPDRTYKIGHATSADGLRWEKEEGRRIISDSISTDESQALPTVISIDGRHHMFFCFRESFDFRSGKGRGYRIGHAWSDDLSNWTRDDEVPALLPGMPGEWDSETQCYPHVFECDGRVLLLYNGNEFGRHGFGVAVLEQ